MNMDQFRADFQTVFVTWRSQGEISQAEYEQQREEAAQAVQANLHNPEWMESVSAWFR